MTPEDAVKTKLEILRDTLEIKNASDELIEQEWRKELEAMEIYAKQDSIAFAEWFAKNANYAFGLWWINDEESDDGMTVEQIYSLFKKEQSKK